MSPPSESSKLLPPSSRRGRDDARTGVAMGSSGRRVSAAFGSGRDRRPSILEALRLESHGGAEVSEVELFSDLAVVVAIHVVSDVLAEDMEENDGRGGGFCNAWSWFFCRIVFLYVLWFNCMYLANLSSLYTSNDMSVRHYGIIFGVMVVIVLFTKACQNGDDRAAVGIFLGGHLAVTALFAAEARLAPRPAWIMPERHENIVHVTGLLLRSFLLCCLPLALVLVFFREDDASETSTYLLWAGAWMVVARVIYKAYLGWILDLRDEGSGSGNSARDKLFDKEHLHERYGLVMLIFLGELCFAAASEPGEYYISLCALLTGMGCFLNYFVARVPGRTEAWIRSAWCSIWCQHLHMFLFCTVPTMSVSFVWIIKARELMEVGTGKDIEGKEEQDGLKNFEEPSAILGIAVGAYLILMGGLESLTCDPDRLGGNEGAPRLRLGARVSLNFAVGIALMALSPFIPGHVIAYVVPAVTMSIGIVQVWGSRLVETGVEKETLPKQHFQRIEE